MCYFVNQFLVLLLYFLLDGLLMLPGMEQGMIDWRGVSKENNGASSNTWGHTTMINGNNMLHALTRRFSSTRLFIRLFSSFSCTFGGFLRWLFLSLNFIGASSTQPSEIRLNFEIFFFLFFIIVWVATRDLYCGFLIPAVWSKFRLNRSFEVHLDALVLLSETYNIGARWLLLLSFFCSRSVKSFRTSIPRNVDNMSDIRCRGLTFIFGLFCLSLRSYVRGKSWGKRGGGGKVYSRQWIEGTFHNIRLVMVKVRLIGIVICLRYTFSICTNSRSNRRMYWVLMKGMY